MPLEIERKFLVANERWRAAAGDGRRLRQAYLAAGDRLSVRVRIVGDETALLTLKAARSGAVREEFEYPIPLADAEALFALATGAVIDKTRYRLAHGGHDWEVDVFFGDNAGLVVAEVGLASADEDFDRPGWLGADVTDEHRYYNAALAVRPYRSWRREGR